MEDHLLSTIMRIVSWLRMLDFAVIAVLVANFGYTIVLRREYRNKNLEIDVAQSKQIEALSREVHVLSEREYRLERRLEALLLSQPTNPNILDKGESVLEPTVLMGLVGSVASVISFLQQNKVIPEAKVVLQHFRNRSADPKSPEYQVGRVVTDDDVLEQADLLLGISRTDHLWLERITKKCLEPYRTAIADHGLDEVDLEETRGRTAYCVCSNLDMARKDNGGSFPSEEFKKLWKQFGCK